jgi:hypothetical protein
MKVSPDPVVICAGSEITWIFDNQCGHPIPARIGKRRPKEYPKPEEMHPLDAHSDEELVPHPFPVKSGELSRLTQKVRITAGGKYKYDIVGNRDIETDPEIDVRRGGPVPVASPSPSRSSNTRR